MKLCGYTRCPNWAQWKITRPDGTKDFACQVHKEETVLADVDQHLKFAFVGAVPHGNSNP